MGPERIRQPIASFDDIDDIDDTTVNNNGIGVAFCPAFPAPESRHS